MMPLSIPALVTWAIVTAVMLAAAVNCIWLLWRLSNAMWATNPDMQSLYRRRNLQATEAYCWYWLSITALVASRYYGGFEGLLAAMAAPGLFALGVYRSCTLPPLRDFTAPPGPPDGEHNPAPTDREVDGAT